MVKLDARDRAQLVVIAYQTGLVRAGTGLRTLCNRPGVPPDAVVATAVRSTPKKPTVAGRGLRGPHGTIVCMATYLYRLGRFAFRRRRLVVLVWLGIAGRWHRRRGDPVGSDRRRLLDPRDRVATGGRPARRAVPAGRRRRAPPPGSSSRHPTARRSRSPANSAVVDEHPGPGPPAPQVAEVADPFPGQGDLGRRPDRLRPGRVRRHAAGGDRRGAGRGRHRGRSRLAPPG